MDTKVKVAVVVTNSEGKVLLIKEKLRSKSDALWNVMKGTYGGGETMFVKLANDEASLDVILTHSLGVYISEKEEKMRIQFNYIAVAAHANAHVASAADQERLDESIEEMRWFSADEIAQMSSDDFVSHRAYQLFQDWMSGQSFPLESVKQVSM